MIDNINDNANRVLASTIENQKRLLKQTEFQLSDNEKDVAKMEVKLEKMQDPIESEKLKAELNERNQMSSMYSETIAQYKSNLIELGQDV